MLLDPGQGAGFLLAAVAITLAPGPDNLMVLSLGLARGRRAGMAFGIGCGLGCLSHTLVAALGLAAVIAASPTAFLVLRLCGGAYLLWLGLNALRGAGPFVRVAASWLSCPNSWHRNGAMRDGRWPPWEACSLSRRPCCSVCSGQWPDGSGAGCAPVPGPGAGLTAGPAG